MRGGSGSLFSRQFVLTWVTFGPQRCWSSLQPFLEFTVNLVRCEKLILLHAFEFSNDSNFQEAFAVRQHKKSITDGKVLQWYDSLKNFNVISSEAFLKFTDSPFWWDKSKGNQLNVSNAPWKLWWGSFLRFLLQFSSNWKMLSTTLSWTCCPCHRLAGRVSNRQTHPQRLWIRVPWHLNWSRCWRCWSLSYNILDSSCFPLCRQIRCQPRSLWRSNILGLEREVLTTNGIKLMNTRTFDMSIDE